MSDKYPDNYIEMRGKLSASFLKVFDGLLRDNAPSSYEASETFSGAVYAASLLTPFGLLYRGGQYLYNIAATAAREKLYNDLVTIAFSDERRQLVDRQFCMKSVEEDTITMHDLATCPLEALKIILHPENLNTLKQNALLIQRQRAAVRSEIAALKRGRSTTDDDTRPPLSPVETAQIAEAEERLSQMKTMMEKLREANYPPELMTSFFPPQSPPAPSRTASASSAYREYHVIIERDLGEIALKSAELGKKALKNKRYENAAGTAENMYRIILEAKETWKNSPAMDPAEESAALKHFVETCKDAIHDARHELSQHRGWKQVLADFLNTLIFIGTLSISYHATNKFRLFSPKTDSEKKLDSLEETLDYLISRPDQ